jgi:hypothetical protein
MYIYTFIYIYIGVAAGVAGASKKAGEGKGFFGKKVKGGEAVDSEFEL